MNKLKQLKEALKNPPPERLAQIEYKSHLYQALGITFVCGALIYKGFWWIIFAFIFGLGISYSQGMTAYMKYKTILSIIKPGSIQDYEKDISPSRRRSKIVKHVFGNKIWFLPAIVSVVAAMLIINPTQPRWSLIVSYLFMIIVGYTFLYFGILYWTANYFYRKEIKVRKWKGGVKKND